MTKKIALLADLHWGVRSDSSIFLDHFEKSLNEFYFPTMRKEGVDTVIIAGDVVDRRKFINFKTAQRMREAFLEKLKEREYNVHIIPGNHDCYHKNTNDTNALNELVYGYGFRLHEEPWEMPIHGKDFLFIPWICEENKERVLTAVSNSKARFAIGHLELTGYEMYRGFICEHGMDPNLFWKFEMVMTGHFHKPSSKGNIHYLGAPWQMTWGDWDDARGFNILDPETGRLQFHQNPFEMFRKVVYNDKGLTFENLMEVDWQTFENCYVKIIVVTKENQFWFDRFLEELSKHAADVKVVESFDRPEALPNGEMVSKENMLNFDTMQLLANTIEQGQFNVDKNDLRRFALELYQTAINTDI